MQYYGQITGPFTAYQNIIKLIQNQNGGLGSYLIKVGLQAPTKTEVIINGKLFLVGRTKILELENIYINSLYFNKDMTSDIIIDYILKD